MRPSRPTADTAYSELLWAETHQPWHRWSAADVGTALGRPQASPHRSGRSLQSPLSPGLSGARVPLARHGRPSRPCRSEHAGCVDHAESGLAIQRGERAHARGVVALDEVPVADQVQVALGAGQRDVEQLRGGYLALCAVEVCDPRPAWLIVLHEIDDHRVELAALEAMRGTTGHPESVPAGAPRGAISVRTVGTDHAGVLCGRVRVQGNDGEQVQTE